MLTLSNFNLKLGLQRIDVNFLLEALFGSTPKRLLGALSALIVQQMFTKLYCVLDLMLCAFQGLSHLLRTRMI